MTRAEAIEWLEYHIATTDYDKDDDLLNALKYAVRKLKAEPKYGRWKRQGMGDYMCSRCAEWVSGNRYHYCPNCGADMRGEK